MRVNNSIINISVGIGNQLIITFLSFFSRTVFIQTLGVEYLGLNGLFTNVLAMLSLAEAGIGSSIIYSLYKPVAENDYEKINVLMKLYKRAYTIIAFVVLLLGLAIMPFLPYFIKDHSLQNIQIIYLLFLANTVIPYFFSYKTNLLNVYQKSYITTAIFSGLSIASTLLKIGILYWTQNYVYYLIIDCLIILINSLLLFVIVNRMYPFLKEKVTAKLDAATKSGIIKNVKAIILQNVGTYFIFGTSNIMISTFVSIAAVGLYSNYNMLIEICRTFINQVFNNIYHSVGNLVAKESKEKIYSVYKVTMLMNFWLYSFCAIFMYVIIEPFITLWIGKQFIMEKMVLIVLMVTFYERGMRNSISTVKTTAGIFHEDRYAPLCQAAINLGISIWLVQAIGLSGVFIGALISALLVPFWTTPYFVYKKVFQRPLTHYYATYAYYAAIALGTCLLTSWLCHWFAADTVGMLIIKMIICMIVPNMVYAALFYKTEEMKYVLGIVRELLGKVLGKVKRTPSPSLPSES